MKKANKYLNLSVLYSISIEYNLECKLEDDSDRNEDAMMNVFAC